MTVTLEIQKTVYGGDGLGRLGDGRVCFVPGAYAGETVKAEIVEQKKRYVKARLVEVVEALPDRLPPDPARAVVPGMVYHDVSYAAELRFKQDQLENFLWKVAQEVLPLEVVPSDRQLNYRTKATYHTEKRGGRWLFGYRRELSHEVVDIAQDPLACPEINAALPSVRAGVMALLTQGAAGVRRSAAAEDVTVRWTPIDGVKWWLGAPPQGLELHERTAGMRFAVPGDGFYQVNPEIGEKLAAAVRDAYLDGLDVAPNILDLYCGVGVFGLLCLKGAEGSAATPRLVGVESGRAAIAAAKKNAAAAGLAANFFCERVGGSLGRIKLGPRHTVILDPPRGGLEPNVAPWLAKRAVPRVFYVSCDPATLTRDLQALSSTYRIVDVKLFDMFPRTARFETFVELSRR
jgi:23S rRNA (uracil1939-C5)-methyltransferase